MKIQIVEKELKHILSLTSEEVVRLIRFQKPTNRFGAMYEVVSPILVIAGGKKFQVTLLRVTSEEAPTYDDPYSMELGGLSSTRKSSADKIEFVAVGELSFDMIQPMVEAESILVLMRAKDRPVYCRLSDFKILYDREYAVARGVGGEGKKILLELKIAGVKPIEDLLKAQITDEQFYDVFVMGRAEEFYLGSSKDLDDLVGMIGVKRRVDEDDFALRRRVVRYLRRQIEEPPITDEEVNKILRQTEEEQKNEGKMDDAKKKKKGNGEDK